MLVLLFNYFFPMFLLAFCKTIDFLTISENDFTKFKQFTDEVMPVMLADELLITVMIQFSARGAYLPLAPQGRALIRHWALIRDRALIEFVEKQPNVQDRT